MEFPSTQWSLLAEATLNGDTRGRDALAEFYRQYHEPVVAFVRRRGFPPDDIEDLAHEFFVHLMEKTTLRRADASRGRFRSFLLGALVRFLAHARDRRHAAKRGGGHAPVSFDELAGSAAEPNVPAVEQHAYDRDWAVQLLRRALAQVEAEFMQRGRTADFIVLRAYLPGAGHPPPAYEDSAVRLGLGLGAFKTEVHRLRLRVREVLRREIAATVSSPEQIEDEVAYLGRVLQGAMG
jgi:DNA-directed RNA polymerase specialized sigma24 family protein